MTPHPRNEKWYLIAERVSKEKDPEKLEALIAQLCAALDERLNIVRETRTDAKQSSYQADT